MKHLKMTTTAIATVMALNSSAHAQMLTILAGDTPDTIANIEALVAAFGKKTRMSALMSNSVPAEPTVTTS